jgi:type IV secretory pathway TraG/TraD family ATPase VirD4
MRYIILIAVGLTVLAFARWALWPHTYLPRFRAMDMRMRLRLRLHPGRGFATLPELWARWGRFASFRQSRRSRPGTSLWQRMTRADGHGVFLGRAQWRHGVRLPIQEHATIIGPPRVGKSGLLARIILRYPGPVVSTSTKPDMFALTSGIRERRGPVYVFNPQRIGGAGMASTIRWNPVAGCQDEPTAIRRAAAFCEAVGTEGTEDATFWHEQAASQLQGLLAAAALGGRDMRSVTYWILSGQTQDAERLLLGHGMTAWAATLAQMRGKAERTAATIRMVLTTAVAFMSDPNLAETVLPDDAGFDIGEFLASSATLYLIGESRGRTSPIAPLFACMVSEIHWTAAQLASAMKGGRLDPPLGLALDEVTQICPIPLPSILADSGGRGIQIITACHGIAQLRERWREHGARAVLDTSNQLFMGGILDADTLEMASRLCGEASFRERGSKDRITLAPKAPPELIRRMPKRRGLILRGDSSPVIARVPQAWRDWRYLLAKARGQEMAQLIPVPSLARQPLQTVPFQPADADAEAADGPQMADLFSDLNTGGNGKGTERHKGNGNGKRPSPRSPWGGEAS